MKSCYVFIQICNPVISTVQNTELYIEVYIGLLVRGRPEPVVGRRPIVFFGQSGIAGS